MRSESAMRSALFFPAHCALLLALALLSGCSDGSSSPASVVAPPSTPIANQPPTADAGNDRSSVELATVMLGGAGSDADGSVAGFLWNQVSGPMVQLANASSRNASFTAPDVAVTTVLRFRLRVTDNTGAMAEDLIDITILDNLPPVANAGADRDVDELSAVSLTGSGSDADGSITRFAWTQIAGPMVALSGADTAVLRFTAPDVTATTPLRFRLRATDNQGASAEDEVLLSVLNNLPPVADAGADRSADELAALSLTGSGNDGDGRITRFAWTQVAGPTTTLSGADTATVQFAAPAVAADTLMRLRLTVTDDKGAIGEDEIVITILKNLPPVARAGADRSVDENAQVSLAGEASDPNNTVSTFAWSQLSGPAITLTAANTASPGFTAPAVAGTATAPVVLRLTVRDPGGLTATDDLNIAITDLTRLSIADGHALEGNDANATTPLAFTVKLSSAQPAPVTVSFATAAGSASERLDYTAKTGALSFAAGETSKQIVIDAAGDVIDEVDETLSLNLTGLVGALPGRLSAIGTISEGACTPDNTGWQSYPHLMGSMHEHSGFSDGDVGSTPVNYFSAGRDLGLSFMGSSEHSDGTQAPLNTNGDCASADFFDCVNPMPTPANPDASVNKWRDTERMAVAASTPMFTAFRGYEYTTDRFGHINVFMSTNYALAKSDGGYAALEAFWNWLKTPVAANGGADGIVVFNHPGREDSIGADDPAYAYNDFAYVSEADPQVVGVEMFGKGGDAYESGNNAPTSGWYARGLDRGWHLGPLGSEDEHGREWAKPNRAKTVLIARNNQLSSLREAFSARRFYAISQNNNALRLSFAAEGAPMGARLTRAAGHKLQIAGALTAGENVGGSLELVTRNGQVVMTSNTHELVYVATVAEGGEAYFYLRVKNATGKPVAYSAPIWVRNAEYAACRQGSPAQVVIPAKAGIQSLLTR